MQHPAAWCSSAGAPSDWVDKPTPDSTRLEEQDSHLAKVKVNEMLRLVRDIRPEVAANDGVPRGVVLLVELLLDEGRDIFFDVVLLEGLSRTVDGVLLHV